MSNHHNCPGLYRCIDHPKWRIWKNQADKWWVTEPPGPGSSLHWQGHYSHAEAFDSAYQEALREIYLKGWNEEDEAFSRAAHKRSIEVIRRSIERIGD